MSRVRVSSSEMTTRPAALDCWGGGEEGGERERERDGSRWAAVCVKAGVSSCRPSDGAVTPRARGARARGVTGVERWGEGAGRRAARILTLPASCVPALTLGPAPPFHWQLPDLGADSRPPRPAAHCQAPSKDSWDPLSLHLHVSHLEELDAHAPRPLVIPSPALLVEAVHFHPLQDGHGRSGWGGGGGRGGRGCRRRRGGGAVVAAVHHGPWAAGEGELENEERDQSDSESGAVLSAHCRNLLLLDVPGQVRGFAFE